MNVLALDISTKTGFAYFQDSKLTEYGIISLDKKINDFGEYPKNFFDHADLLSQEIYKKVIHYMSENLIVVIEETNKSRGVYQQKILEFTHCLLIRWLIKAAFIKNVKYLRTGTWRKSVEMKLSEDDKKRNKLVKMKLGRGKVTKKHLAVRLVNAIWDLKFKMKDNDVCDAILLGQAYINGAEPSKGIQ